MLIVGDVIIISTTLLGIKESQHHWAAKHFFDELESQQPLEEALVVNSEQRYPEKMYYSIM